MDLGTPDDPQARIEKALQQIATHGGLQSYDDLLNQNLHEFFHVEGMTPVQQAEALYRYVVERVAALSIGDRIRRGIQVGLAITIDTESASNKHEDMQDCVQQAASSGRAGLHDRMRLFEDCMDQKTGFIRQGPRPKTPLKTIRDAWSDGRGYLAREILIASEHRTKLQNWLNVSPSHTEAEHLSAQAPGVLPSSPPRSGAQSLSEVASAVYAARQWPFELIVPSAADRPCHWQSVLDGAPLTPDHARHGAIAERRVRVRRQEMDEQRFAAWLADQVGETILLQGGTGDGKSAYVNRLAVGALSSHVFVRWPWRTPFNFQELRDFRQEVTIQTQSSDINFRPTVVVCCTRIPYASRSVESRLREQLIERQHSGDELVVLIDGRPGDLDRLGRGLSAERASLLPVNQAEALTLARLIRKAHDNVTRSPDYDEAEHAASYPNLGAFLALDEVTQVKLLTEDPKAPQLVRVLKAVYGPDMWAKLMDELEELSEADRLAYIHVCLASLTGNPLPRFALESLAPGSNISARCNHDPWMLNQDDLHVARHQVIAQVVLEMLDRRRHYILEECLNAYCKVLQQNSQPYYLDALNGVMDAVEQLTPIAQEADTALLRSRLREAVVRALNTVDNLGRLIISRSAGRYGFALDWAARIAKFAPRDTSAHRHLHLIEGATTLYRHLYESSEFRNKDMVSYRLARLQYQRASIHRNLNTELTESLVDGIRPFVGSDWCNSAFYRDLFEWAGDIRRALPNRRLTGNELEHARATYKDILTAYEYFRTKPNQPRVATRLHRDLSMVARFYIHVHLPAATTARLTKEAWELSISIDSPDAEMASIHAELLLSRAATASAAYAADLRRQAIRFIQAALKSEAANGELILLWTRLILASQSRPSDLIGPAEATLNSKPTDIQATYIKHSQAITMPEPLERAALMREVAAEYYGYSRTNDYFFLRVKGAWDFLCQDLELMQVRGWQQYRQQYESEFGRKYERL